MTRDRESPHAAVGVPPNVIGAAGDHAPHAALPPARGAWSMLPWLLPLLVLALAPFAPFAL